MCARIQILCIHSLRRAVSQQSLYNAAVNESESRGDVLIALALRLARRALALYEQHTRSSSLI